MIRFDREGKASRLNMRVAGVLEIKQSAIEVCIQATILCKSNLLHPASENLFLDCTPHLPLNPCFTLFILSKNPKLPCLTLWYVHRPKGPPKVSIYFCNSERVIIDSHAAEPSFLPFLLLSIFLLTHPPTPLSLLSFLSSYIAIGQTEILNLIGLCLVRVTYTYPACFKIENCAQVSKIDCPPKT